MKNNVNDAIFYENEEPDEDDLILFSSEPKPDDSTEEQKFWRDMKKKVLGEFAPSGDLLISEHDNDDELYVVRYYFNEFKIGRGRVNERNREAVYANSFSEALGTDLFPLLDRHITLLDWLKERDFKGIDYDGNYALH